MSQCPEHPYIALQRKKRGWYCAACDDIVFTYEEGPQEGVKQAPAPTSPVGAGGNSLAASLPTLLALPLAEFVRERVPVLALWAMCDLAEMALKLVVMTGIGEHTCKSGVVDPRATLPDELVRELRDHVELPTMGRWLAMALAVAKHAPKVSTLPLSPLVASLKTLMAAHPTNPELGLLPLRNHLAHAGPVGRAEAERLLSVWRPRVLAWADDALRWLVDVRLIVIDGEGRRCVLRGESGDELSDSLLGNNVRPPDDAPPGSAWLCSATQALPLGPLGAFDIESRALQVYYRSGEVRLQYLRLGDAGGVYESDVQARDRFRALFLSSSSAGPRGRKPFVIHDFVAEIRQEAARRVGREAELATLRMAANALHDGALWVAGPAGIGKSNLMAALMEEWLDHPPEGALVLPYRFRAGNDRCGRSPFLNYLRERLEASDALAPLAKNTSHENDDGAKATAAVVNSDLVQDVKVLLERLLPERRVLLVLDGLDEIVERDARFVDDVLVRLRTPRLALIAAGRHERGLPERFARLGAVIPFPDGLPAMRDDDVRALLLERTGPVRRRLIGRDKEFGGKVVNAFVDAVARRAAGLPIYVNYVVGDLNAGKLSPEQTDTLPASLHAYHDELLRRVAVGDLQAVTTPTLVLLALAHEPLSVDEVAALLARCGKLGTATTIQGSPAALVERVLQVLGAMVRRAPNPDGEDGYTLFHHSLRTHIVGSRDVEHTVTTLRASLAETALRPADDGAEVYLYRCGVRHMLDADRTEDALRLVTDFERLMARFQRLDKTGSAVDGWYADWERVRARTGSLEGAARQWWDFAQTCRHSFRKDGWESWRVLFQAAMDHADDSVVTLAAEAFEAGGQRTWAWLRWGNRPQVWQESPCLAVMVGHTDSVEGAVALDCGRLLSWSDDGTLRLWDGTTGAPLTVLEGHTHSVNGALGLDDGRLLSWSLDKTLLIWDAATGVPLAVLKGHTSRVAGALALDDGRILSWSSDKTLRLWLGATGAPLAVLEGHTRGVEGALALDDGRILSWSSDNTLRLWRGATGAPLAVLEGHTAMVRGALTLDCGRLLSWSVDNTLRLWGTATGAPLAVLEGHTHFVEGALALDDGRIVSWSRDMTLRLWDAATGTPIAVLEGHKDTVLGALTIDGGRLLSWSADNALRLWEVATGAPVAALEGHKDTVRGALAVCGGRLRSWSDDHTLRTWDAATGAPLDILEGHTSRVAGLLLVDGGRLLSWSWDGTLRLWNGATGAMVAVLEAHTDKVRGLVALDGRRLLSWSFERSPRLWDAATGAPLAVLEGHTSRLAGALALDAGRILSWSNDKTLRLWHGATGAPLAVLEGHTSRVAGVLPLDDGRLLSWSSDNTLRLWDAATGAPLHVLRGHTSLVSGACVLTDGRLLSWSLDGTLRLWSAATGATLAVLKGHTLRVNAALALDGGRILSWSDDQTLRLWDAATGAPVAVLKGHTDEIRDVLALDGGRILSWSDDQTLRLWDAATGAPLTVLEGHTHWVEGALALDGGRLLSWSADQTLRLWDAATGEPLAILEGHTARVLGALALDGGRVLSWSNDESLRLWDAATGAPLAVLATPRDWLSTDAAQVAEVRPHARALHHALHVGYDVADAGEDIAVFTAGRHLRFCRFVPATASTTPRATSSSWSASRGIR
jgi:WD40 repeat protein